MRNKIRLFIGWFGVLTPVYAAGVVTVLLTIGNVDGGFILRVVAVSAINCFIGYKILKMKIVGKEAKNKITCDKKPKSLPTLESKTVVLGKGK